MSFNKSALINIVLFYYSYNCWVC